MIVYHNESCSKSCAAIDMLNRKNQTFEVVEYLKTPLLREEIEQLINLLGIRPIELIRKNESIFREYEKIDLSDAALIDLLVKHPILIQRPIIVNGNRAVIGRPIEKVLSIL